MLEKLFQILDDCQVEKTNSEALIKIATFFYKIDGRISLEE